MDTSDFAGYRWEVKKVVKPGETEPVIQMHLVPPEEELRRQREDHAQLMEQLKTKGYIDLPEELAREVGFKRWCPKHQGQTNKVLAVLARGAPAGVLTTPPA